MRRDRIQPAALYVPETYSHAIKRGDTIFIAGQVSKNERNELVGQGDIDAQAEQVFRNFLFVCEAAGAAAADVVKLNIFATRLEHYRPHITQVRDRVFGAAPPATTFVVVTSLAHPDLLLEVDGIAVLGE